MNSGWNCLGMASAAKILLIDDDDNDALLIGRMVGGIQESEYAFRWTRDYTQGLQCLQEASWDLCLVDYNLGARSGIDLLREAQKKRLQSCFVLLTGCGNKDLDLSAMHAGAAGYLEKDLLHPKYLERTLRYALANRVGRGATVCRPHPNSDSLWRVPPAALSLIRGAFVSGADCVLAPLVLERHETLERRLGTGLGALMANLAAHLRQRLSVSELLFELNGPGLLLMSSGIDASEAQAYFSLVLSERLASFAPAGVHGAPISARWTTFSRANHPAPEALLGALERFFSAPAYLPSGTTSMAFTQA